MAGLLGCHVPGVPDRGEQRGVGEEAATERLITNLDLLATCVYGSGDEAPLLTQTTMKDIEIPKYVTLCWCCVCVCVCVCVCARQRAFTSRAP